MLINRLHGCLLAAVFVGMMGSSRVVADTPSDISITIGTTPVFLDYKTGFLNEWRAYLERRIGRPVKLKQRSNYREVIDLLLDGQLDFAWICGYPYVRHQKQLRLLAVPLYRKEPLYRSYLIVPADDQTTTSLEQLEGKIFAYSDPDSNSGYLVPQYQLRRNGADPRIFFQKSFFTWAHEKVVKAVASGLADGGAVDGYVWDTLELINPTLTARTRVVSKSEKFGFPPIVARNDVDPQIFKQVQEVFLTMDDNRYGRELLERLNLDGFVERGPNLFQSIDRMVRFISDDAGAEEPKPTL